MSNLLLNSSVSFSIISQDLFLIELENVAILSILNRLMQATKRKVHKTKEIKWFLDINDSFWRNIHKKTVIIREDVYRTRLIPDLTLMWTMK